MKSKALFFLAFFVLAVNVVFTLSIQGRHASAVSGIYKTSVYKENMSSRNIGSGHIQVAPSGQSVFDTVSLKADPADSRTIGLGDVNYTQAKKEGKHPLTLLLFGFILLGVADITRKVFS